MAKKAAEVLDEDVKIKQSICPKCDGVVRSAVLHLLKGKSKNEFAKEVMDYNLSVREISLMEYRAATTTQWCKCSD